MIIPSSMVLAQGAEFDIKEVAKGLYSVTNAYAGEYQYFKDRTIPRVVTATVRDAAIGVIKREDR